MAVVSNLIFDIGAHTGEDTDFYIGKGFDVVAVEANPHLANKLRSRFFGYMMTSRLSVVDKAIMRGRNEKVSFFVNEDHDDWSSVHRDVATKGAMSVKEITVGSVTLAELCAEFGTPYFLKVDIEMGDLAVAESLTDLDVLPPYVSFEFHEQRILDLLSAAGYSQFQIVNQWLNGLVTPVVPPREGSDYWPGGFTGFHSGYFGRDLPVDDWVDAARARELGAACSVVRKYGLMKNSWFDLHARR